MKETVTTKAIDKAIEIKLKAVDRFMAEYVEPLSDVGNPEKLLKKKYEEWTPQDVELLKTIYGEGNETPLAKVIATREYEKVKQMEAEVL